MIGLSMLYIGLIIAGFGSGIYMWIESTKAGYEAGKLNAVVSFILGFVALCVYINILETNGVL